MTEPGLTVLVAARDEAPRIGRTVAALREAFPEAEIVVADDGSRDGTASVASDAGARVVSLPRRGKGQALALAERECREGPLLLCDADLVGDLRPLVENDADLAVARFARRAGGGLGLAKGGGPQPDRAPGWAPASRSRCPGSARSPLGRAPRCSRSLRASASRRG